MPGHSHATGAHWPGGVRGSPKRHGPPCGRGAGGEGRRGGGEHRLSGSRRRPRAPGRALRGEAVGFAHPAALRRGACSAPAPPAGAGHRGRAAGVSPASALRRAGLSHGTRAARGRGEGKEPTADPAPGAGACGVRYPRHLSCASGEGRAGLGRWPQRPERRGQATAPDAACASGCCRPVWAAGSSLEAGGEGERPSPPGRQSGGF